MSESVTIALDAMGGDDGASVVVPAALQALQRHSQLHLILVGDESVLTPALSQQNYDKARLTIHHATQVVEMDDPPALALRTKKDSSMRVAINLVKEGVASACVSSGNTGALMATARYVLKTLPGIDRPAIASSLPTTKGHTHMLDLGANVGCSADHLYQFAVMGSILSSAVDGLSSPRVGLLNIGSEDIKGSDEIREAGRMLQGSNLNYTGFIEGNGIHTGEADVVVCDGFVGNVSLKTSEGVAKMVSYYLREEFKRSMLNKLVGLLAMPVLNAFKSRVDPRNYNGASLLGLKGIVVKSHGGADAVAFANAVDIALLEVAQNVPELIRQQLEIQLGEVSA